MLSSALQSTYLAVPYHFLLTHLLFQFLGIPSLLQCVKLLLCLCQCILWIQIDVFTLLKLPNLKCFVCIHHFLHMEHHFLWFVAWGLDFYYLVSWYKYYCPAWFLCVLQPSARLHNSSYSSENIFVLVSWLSRKFHQHFGPSFLVLAQFFAFLFINLSLAMTSFVVRVTFFLQKFPFVQWSPLCSSPWFSKILVLSVNFFSSMSPF